MLKRVSTLLVFAATAAANAQYSVTNLVSDGYVPAAHIDPNLVNPWGMAASPTSPIWIADNGTNVSTLYTTTGAPISLVVSTQSSPSGMVYNGGTGFGGKRFLFASESGQISGWTSGTTAPVLIDSSASGARYKGLAILNNSDIYAANFASGTIDQFDGTLASVRSFSDPNIPSGYAPFGIQGIGSDLFVTYAKVGPTGDDVAGAGNGYVDEFDSSGNLIKRVASNGALNSPWGLALAPSNFGAFSGDLLVGNFGDGKINAFDPTTGTYEGALTDAMGNPLAIDGLWGLQFGNGSGSGPTNQLLFTAGLNGEQDGLYGAINPVPEPSMFLGLGLGALALVRRKKAS